MTNTRQKVLCRNVYRMSAEMCRMSLMLEQERIQNRLDKISEHYVTCQRHYPVFTIYQNYYEEMTECSVRGVRRRKTPRRPKYKNRIKRTKLIVHFRCSFPHFLVVVSCNFWFQGPIYIKMEITKPQLLC